MQLIGADVFNTIIDWLIGLINLIPKFMYFICVSLMSVLDFFQFIIRKLAGLDTYYVNGSEQSGDILLSFIKGIFVEDSNFPALKTVFWSLVIFGILLLIVATIIAIIRQEYMPSDADAKDKPSNNKSRIIASSVRSLFLFLIVPVSCIFGLLLSDVLLSTLDSITTGSGGATELTTSINSNLLQENTLTNGVSTYSHYDMFGFHEPTSSTTFSGMMFKVAAYEANRVRSDQEMFEGLHNGQVDSFNLFNQATTQEECALLIDEAFANCVKLKSTTPIKVKDTLLDGTANVLVFAVYDGHNVNYFSKFNVGLVFYYYNLWNFNFLIAFAFLVVSLKLMVNIVFGLAKRIIEMLALFIVSPPIVAVMPLDNGKAFGNWRQNFISKALSAYGAIIGMNVLFLILPYFNEIQFFDPGRFGMGFLNLIMSMLFIIVGLSMVDGLIKLVSGLIGAEDVAKAGADLSSKVGETLSGAAKLTGATAGLAMKAASLPAKGMVAGAKAFSKSKAGQALGGAAVGAATKIGQKLTGNKDFDFKPILSSAKSTLENLKPANLFTGKARKQADESFKKDWQKEGASRAHADYVTSSEQYDEEMKKRYDNRAKTHSGKSFDEWIQTKEGKNASKDIVDNAGKYGLESFEDYTKGVQIDEEGNATVDDKSAIGKIFNQQRKDAIEKAVKEKNAAIGRGILKYSGAKYVASYLGDNIGAVGSIYFDNIKSAMVTGGKGGIKSMVSAFQGKTATQIEQAEMLKKVQKEEAAKVRAQQAAKGATDDKQNSKIREQESSISKVFEQQEKMQRSYNKKISELEAEIKRLSDKEKKNKK